MSASVWERREERSRDASGVEAEVEGEERVDEGEEEVVVVVGPVLEVNFE